MTSKADLARYRKLVDYGCVCCNELGIYTPPDMHHVLSGGRRMGNKFTIPLCPYHHRGVKAYWVDAKDGPSLADGSKPFEKRWGTQAQLLERVNKAIEAK